MGDYTRPKYQGGYEIRYNSTVDQFECWQGTILLSKKDGKAASYKALGLAIKFMNVRGAKEADPEPKKTAWTRPEPVEIAPLEEQLAALTAGRFVVIEKHISIYKERGYGVYDREEQEIVCPHTYNGINFLSYKREDAEKEAEYRQDHPPVKIEPDLEILNTLIEAEEEWTHRFSRPQPEPTPSEEKEVVIDTHERVGIVVQFEGKKWLVTETEYLSSADVDEAEEGFDVFLAPGWHSTLVSLDPDVMTALAEQYEVGQAQFPSRDTVKFPDEEHAVKLSDLAYSQEIGLYDKTKVSL